LLQYTPLAIAVSATDWENYGSSSGILSCTSTSNVNHAVLLTGYTADYWIIKNQWGSAWGNNGYAKISRLTANNSNCWIGRGVYALGGVSTSNEIKLVLTFMFLLLLSCLI
jgi:C1A family cysteine protease